jgi:hypothetical protein
LEVGIISVRPDMICFYFSHLHRHSFKALRNGCVLGGEMEAGGRRGQKAPLFPESVLAMNKISLS